MRSALWSLSVSHAPFLASTPAHQCCSVPSLPVGFLLPANMAGFSFSDIVVLGLGVGIAAYLFKDSIFPASSAKSVPVPSSKSAVGNGSGNPRDFVAKMKESVRLQPFYPLSTRS